MTEETVIVEWSEFQQTPHGRFQRGDISELPVSVANIYMSRELCFIPESVMVTYKEKRDSYTYRYKRKKYVFFRNRPRIVPTIIARELKHYPQAFDVRPIGYTNIIPSSIPKLTEIRSTQDVTDVTQTRVDRNKHYIISYNGNHGDVLRATCLAETLYNMGYTVSFNVKKSIVTLLENNPFICSQKPKDKPTEIIDLDKIRVHELESKNVLRTLTWLKEMGLEDSPFRKPSYFPTRDELRYAERIVKPDRFSIGLGTRSSVPGKTWHGFAELATRLKKNSQVIILDKMVGGAHPGFSEHRYTIRQLGAIMYKCDLIITNDSFILHLAGATDTPCIGLFGNTNGKVMTQSYPFCIPIQGRCEKGRKEPCWYDVCGQYHEGELACLKNISVDDVISAVNKMRC